jgi:hypothetical protein
MVQSGPSFSNRGGVNIQTAQNPFSKTIIIVIKSKK